MSEILLESQEQEVVFDWAALNERKYPCLKLLYAIPNGEYRPKATAARLKRCGVKAGVPDMHLPVPAHGYCGLYIELKAKNGRVSKAQLDFIKSVKEYKNAAYVCFGADEAISVLEWYLGVNGTMKRGGNA
jgi:hypothetical protein